MTVINRYEFLRGITISKISEPEKNSLLKIIEKLKIYDLTERTVSYCVDIYSKLRKRGKLISELDVLIGGICLENKETLVTNDKDFINMAEETDLKIEFVETR